MKPLYLVKNKGREICREMQAIDPARSSYNQNKQKEDAAKFRQIIHESRVRLGLEVARA